MHPYTEGTSVVADLDGRPVRVDLAKLTLLAGNDWWDGHNYERSGRNSFLFRTPKGRFLLQRRTQWQGEEDGAIGFVPESEAIDYFLSQPEGSQRVSFEEGFPGVELDEA